MRIAAALFCLTVFAHAAGEETDKIQIEIEKDMELSAFLDIIAQATARPVLYDPSGQRIRGQKMGTRIAMTVPKSRLLDTFRAILSFYEMTLIPVGPKGYEIYLAVDSRSTNNFVKNKAVYVAADNLSDYADRDGLFIRTYIPVRHIENLTTLRTALSTMVSPAGIGRVHEVSGVGLIVMDFAPTVAGMADIIRLMDVPGANAQTLESIELKYADAKEVAKAVQEIYLAIPAGTPGRPRRGVIPYVRTPRAVAFTGRNAIVVRAGKRQMDAIRALVTKLDRETITKGIVEVIRLEHVNADELADVLTATLLGPTTADWSVRLVPDSRTNSLLVRGDPTTIRGVKDLVNWFDVAVPAKK